jgi:hypothetical protein
MITITSVKPIDVEDTNRIPVGEEPRGIYCHPFTISVLYDRYGVMRTVSFVAKFNLDIRIPRNHHHIERSVQGLGLDRHCYVERISIRS